MKTADYNEDDLSKLAPKLSSFDKKEGFSVPDGYFESLPGQIMDKITAAPELEKIAVSNPFTVPENYFETLPSKISNRIQTEQHKRFTLAGLLAQVLRPKYSLSLIASCFILFICIRYFEKPVMLNIASTASGSASISEADVLDQVDENTLMNVVSEESAAVLKNNSKEENKDKNVEDYIINNNIDLSDVEKEL